MASMAYSTWCRRPARILKNESCKEDTVLLFASQISDAVGLTPSDEVVVDWSVSSRLVITWECTTVVPTKGTVWRKKSAKMRKQKLKRKKKVIVSSQIFSNKSGFYKERKPCTHAHAITRVIHTPATTRVLCTIDLALEGHLLELIAYSSIDT
jgi:hypothetical protein